MLKKGQAALRASVVTTIEQPLRTSNKPDGPVINEALEALKSSKENRSGAQAPGYFTSLQAGFDARRLASTLAHQEYISFA